MFGTAATSPWGDTWILLNLPGFAVPLIWAAAAASRRLSSGVRVGMFGAALAVTLSNARDLVSVASGGLPLSEPWWGVQAGWVVIGVLLAGLYGGKGRIGAVGLALVAACFALQAWIPGVVLLGSATAFGLSMRGQVALLGLLGAIGVRLHAPLQAAAVVGGFLPGWSMDGVSIATAWVLGGFELVGWAAFVAATTAGRARLPSGRPATSARG